MKQMDDAASHEAPAGSCEFVWFKSKVMVVHCALLPFKRALQRTRPPNWDAASVSGRKVCFIAVFSSKPGGATNPEENYNQIKIFTGET